MRRFISRKEVRRRLGDVSAMTLWRLQHRGLLPKSVNAPGKPLDEEEFEKAMERMAKGVSAPV
ncbi:hypothetical protein GF108_06775 [Phyllobacterium sp. SYP-B3895]|uniref:hypothetical protein n=1 Tax=Phyllobacterium sp. SYP-B3895 TaxID=2663240 RepID=UPI001299AE21|nr:hypothetical protein [Phyllobacterium sp. SYP-B3895]MRG55286.1 hypothetical protein [Phyllobacterium sp. SYP-B3895]